MKITILFLLSVLTVSVATARWAEPQPTPTVCQTELKSWSAQKTETLTIEEIKARMAEMVACAEMNKKHEKKMRTYLDEFNRTHSELASRAFDFITDHDLTDQFEEEKNGTAKPEDSDSVTDTQSTI